MTNMITGWFVSLMGLLGQQKPPIKNYPLNYIGVALCASCVIISSFIKNEEEEKEYCLYLLKGPQSIWAAVMSSCGDKQFLGVKGGEGGDA